MAFGVSYQSGAPILGALVGGQGQAREREENQAFEQSSFLARLLEQKRQFDQGLAFDKRRQGHAEKQSHLQNHAQAAAMAQRERLARLQMMGQMGMQQQAQQARMQQMGVGHELDLQRMGVQQQFAGQQQQQQLAAQGAMQEQAQGERRQMMRDENVWRANSAALDADLNQLLKTNYPTQEAFDEVLQQHNRKREMLGHPAVDPQWQGPPPPDPRDATRQQISQTYGEETAAIFQWDEEDRQMKLPSGVRMGDTPWGQQQELARIKAQNEAAVALAEATARAKAQYDNSPSPAQKEYDTLLQDRQDYVEKAAFGAAEDVVSDKTPEQARQAAQETWNRIKGTRLRELEEGLGIAPPQSANSPEALQKQGTPFQPEVPSVSAIRSIRSLDDYHQVVAQLPPVLTNREQFGEDQFEALFTKAITTGEGTDVGSMSVPPPQHLEQRATGRMPQPTGPSDLETLVEEDPRVLELYSRALMEFRMGTPLVLNPTMAHNLPRGTKYIGPDFHVGWAGDSVRNIISKSAGTALSSTLRNQAKAYLELFDHMKDNPSD